MTYFRPLPGVRSLSMGSEIGAGDLAAQAVIHYARGPRQKKPCGGAAGPYTNEWRYVSGCRGCLLAAPPGSIPPEKLRRELEEVGG